MNQIVACAWCRDSKGSAFQCTTCGNCGRFVHGCEAFRGWVTQAEFDAKEFHKGVLEASDVLVCGECVHARREYKNMTNGCAVQVDEQGVVLEPQPCVLCQKPTTAYTWANGRMRFECENHRVWD